MRNLFCSAILLALFLSGAAAHAMGALVVVPSNKTAASYILFNANVGKTSNRDQSLRIYKEGIQKSRELSDFVPLDDFIIDSLSVPTEFAPNRSRPQVLLLANGSKQHVDRTRLEKAYIDPFVKLGADVYVLPIAAAIGLSKIQRKQFYDLISEKFDLMLAAGGDDIAPAIYGEKLTYSINVNKQRDLFEAEVIRNYINRARGFFFGVCRGMQLTAVAFGMKMYQDIATELPEEGPSTSKGFRFKSVPLLQTKNSILKGFVGGASEIVGFFWHHQAVKYVENSQFQVAARVAGSQVPTAIESINGKVLLTQFHPELSWRVDELGKTDLGGWGDKILQGVVAKTKSFAVRSCSGAL